MARPLGVCFMPVYFEINLLQHRISAIIGKTLLKLFASEEYAALDCAERKMHFVGYFIVFIAGNVHRERNTIAVGERVDGFGDFRGGVGTLR